MPEAAAQDNASTQSVPGAAGFFGGALPRTRIQTRSSSFRTATPAGIAKANPSSFQNNDPLGFWPPVLLSRSRPQRHDACLDHAWLRTCGAIGLGTATSLQHVYLAGQGSHLMVTIAVAGHACADLIPELTDSTEITPGHLLEIGRLRIEAGGCVANTGSVLAELGVPITISTSIGDDHLGRIVGDALLARGMDTRGLAVTKAAGTSYSIVVEKPGMNRSIWHHVGANAVFDGSDVVLGDSDLLHIGYPPLLPALVANGGACLAALLSRARGMDVSTSIDMAVVDPDSAAGQVNWSMLLERVLPLTDVFSPSVDDLRSALRLGPALRRDQISALAAQLVGQGAAIVVLSAGGDGLFLRTGSAQRLAAGGRVVRGLALTWADVELWVPAAPVDRVRTTNGAGDAASAGLLGAIASAALPDAALRHAAAVAAAKVQGAEISTVIGR